MEALLKFNPSAIEGNEAIYGSAEFFQEKKDLSFKLNFKIVDPDELIIWNKSSEESSKNTRLNLLWQKTCFEMFFRCSQRSEYYEININELGEWNVYHFHNYRNPAPPQPEPNAQLINFVFDQNRFELNKFEISAEIQIKDFFKKQKADDLELNLTAIIKQSDGTTSYWAVQHAQSQPDFHHQESFILKRKIHGV